MRILFAGHNERGKACFNAILESRHEMVSCLAMPCQESGYYEGIANLAMAKGIHCFMETEINAPWFIRRMKELKADILVMAGYPRIISEELYSSFPKGAINLHASPLPDYRGGSPLNWAIINGETEWAISFIQIDSDIGTGDILLQHKFEISLTDTIADVTQRVNRLYPKHLMRLLDMIENNRVVRKKQDRSKGSYYGKRYPRDGKIDWNNMACIDVYNMVRALTRPYPGAYTTYLGKKVRIWKTEFVVPTHYGTPGRIIRKSHLGAVVMCKDQGILISEMEDLRSMRAGEDLG